jgi:hypothetical protein
MNFQLAYVSTASKPMKRSDLLELLERAREINRERHVTGLLLYQGGHFVQILEGERETVRALFAHIAHDPRHFHVTELFEQELEQRHYAEWSMGFQALDGTEWLEFPGLDGADEDLRGIVEHYGQAKKLLTMMRQRGLDPNKEIATSA